MIEAALGLFWLYLLLNLLGAAAQEWLAALFGLRFRNLRDGVPTLIGVDDACRLCAHPLV